MTRKIILWERASFRESGLTLRKAISDVHAAEETCKHARETLKSNQTIDLHKTWKPLWLLQKPRPNSQHCGKCPAYGKIIPRSAVYVTEKFSTKLNKLKLNHLTVTNTNFSLIFKKTRKIWLAFLKLKVNPPIGIFLYLLMVLQYPIK